MMGRTGWAVTALGAGVAAGLLVRALARRRRSLPESPPVPCVSSRECEPIDEVAVNAGPLPVAGLPPVQASPRPDR